MKRKGLQGLSNALKEQLIQRSLERRGRRLESETDSVPTGHSAASQAQIADQHCRFDLHPGYQQLRLIQEAGEKLAIPSPYLRSHDAVAAANTRINGRDYINFSSYNYLGFSGDSRVAAAAKQAIDRFGTSVSASRVVSGERPVHRDLERALADCYGVADCVGFVSGHATNVTTIGYLFGPKDLVLHDAIIHNSVLQGIQLSGAKRLPFPHNDWEALDRLLSVHRRHFERTLIVIEGLYSMDGDFPDLPRFVEIKERHRAFLMVDEAHSFGVMGQRGLGIREHYGMAGRAVDIWMGTLSKALASCGGFIAGESALIEHLKLAAPGFLYSVGMAPPVAGAALAALNCLKSEPERVGRLHQRAKLLQDGLASVGANVGLSAGVAIVPAIIGSSIKAARLSNALFERGLNVQPILYPAVEERTARLRFFVSCDHSEEQIQTACRLVGEELGKL